MFASIHLESRSSCDTLVSKLTIAAGLRWDSPKTCNCNVLFDLIKLNFNLIFPFSSFSPLNLDQHLEQKR